MRDMAAALIIENRRLLLVYNIKTEKLFATEMTSSPEGSFKCALFRSHIISGELQLLEPEKISAFGWYTLQDLKKFEKKGILVPNIVSILPLLKKYID